MSLSAIEITNRMKTEYKLRNWVQPLFLLYFSLFSLYFFMQAVNNPAYNWDMIAYVGSVKSFETDDKEVIHEFAYSELGRSVDAATFDALTTASDYRHTLYKDPESFRQVLPWYQIRPVYTGLIYAINKLGVNIYFASYLIPAISVIIGLWVFYLAFRPYIADTLWFAIPFFIVLNGTVRVAHSSSPDGLAFLWVSILSYLFLRRHSLFLWLLPLSVIVRTDLIFLVALFLAYLFWSYSLERRKSVRRQGFRFIKTQRGKVVVASLASLIMYFIINSMYANYGWAKVFHLMFISRLNYPADTLVHIEFMQYISVVAQRIPGMLQNNGLDLFLGFLILHLGIMLNSKELRNKFVSLQSQRINALMVISCIYIFIHFMIFPEDDSRFFIAQYLIGFLAFLSLISRISGFEPTLEQKARRKYVD